MTPTEAPAAAPRRSAEPLPGAGDSELLSPEAIGLLRGVGRRLRLAWGFAWVQLLAPVVVVTALALVIIGRVRPWGWTEPVAIAVTVAGVVAVAIGALTLRIPLGLSARATDRGLATRDAFATALELDDHDRDGPFGSRVRARADALAEDRSPGEAVAVRAAWGPWAVAAVAALAAVTLGLVANPQDQIREQQAAEQALVAEEAEALREAAEELRADPAATAADVALAERLEELAVGLDEAQSLDEAEALLAEAEAELRAAVEPDLLAQKAAAQGLDKGLASAPLPATEGGDAAAQLEQAAASLDQRSAAEKEELATRLESLAETQAAGNPEAADALDAAAAALRSGDDAAAAASMTTAAGAQRSSSASAAAQESRQRASGGVGEARQRVAKGPGSPGSGEGRGEGEGEGEGDGDGDGDGAGSGQGKGQGQGQGQGEGEGEGGGQGQGGGAQGQVGGANGSTGSGQGGQGTPDGTGTNDAPAVEQDPTVFDPGVATDGETLDAGGTPNGGDSTEVGKGQGTSTAGGSRVPVSGALPRYEEKATRALDQAKVPPSVRSLVDDYFRRLAQR